METMTLTLKKKGLRSYITPLPVGFIGNKNENMKSIRNKDFQVFGSVPYKYFSKLSTLKHFFITSFHEDDINVDFQIGNSLDQAENIFGTCDIDDLVVDGQFYADQKIPAIALSKIKYELINS